MMNKFLKRILTLTLVIFLGLGLIACTNDDDADEPTTGETEAVTDASTAPTEGIGGDLRPTNDLAADVQARFARDSNFDIVESITVARDHVFRFELTYEVAEGVFREILMDPDRGTWEILNIYRDSALTQRVAFTANANEDDFTYLEVMPPRQPVFYLTENPQDLIDREVRDDWGNAGQYFFVKYYDFETGEKLARPQVTIFNVETEVAGAPRVTFNMTDDGVAGLRWDPLPGAVSYQVVYIAESLDGMRTWRPMVFVEETTETSWDDIEILTDDRGSRRNHVFRSFMEDDTTADELYDLFSDLIESGEMTLEEFEAIRFDFDNELLLDNNIYLAVIATNSQGTSAISNLIDIRSIAPRVPIRLSDNMNEGGVIPSEDHPSSVVEVETDVLSAPTHAWMIMGDGNVGRRLINYDVDAAIRGDVAGYEADGTHILVASADSDMILIPYTIEGTHFTGVVKLTDYSATFEADLQELAERQDGLRSRGGDLARTVNLNPDFDDEVIDDEIVTDLRSNFEVRASSPLSAYLAIQMFNGQTRINLDDFPEAADHEYLVEAWFAAVLQNPLVLGARSIQLDWRTGDLLVTYDQDAQTQQRQQEAIMARVDEIVDEIIVPGMSDLEIQLAINAFLIEHATYDFGALDNAEQNNFMFVDPEFYDSFTAYGILINGVGVCSGYADAFTLIADQAGLESVIVTGYLQGSLPHAWNRVYIDGEWLTLDVTNNDNEFFPNAFFNLSDFEAATILVEDDQWYLNSGISRFVARTSEATEYYRHNERFFDHVEIVDALVAGIRANGSATYRTDVMLTDEQFMLIAVEVASELNNWDLLGGHFLGVIHMFEE